jgi:hypothetical protein
LCAVPFSDVVELDECRCDRVHKTILRRAAARRYVNPS